MKNNGLTNITEGVKIEINIYLRRFYNQFDTYNVV